MVGIPGASKGCHTCRRRKVKCDEGAPSCERCGKAGRVCEGYQRLPVFLNRTSNGLLQRRHMEEAVPHSRVLSTLSPQVNTINQQISLSSAWKKRIEEYFLEKFFAQDLTSSSPLPNGYVLQIIAEFPRDCLLEASIEALCLSRVGRLNGDDRMVRRGVQSYSLALQKLRIAMSEYSMRSRDSTLAAAKMMNLYEFFEPSYNSGMAVYSHTLGVERLVDAKKLDGSIHSKVIKGLLKSCRFNSMIASVKGFSQASPLALLKVENAIDGNSIERMEHSLIDIGFSISSVLRDYEQLRHKSSAEWCAVEFQQLIERFCDVHYNLEAWYTSFIDWYQTPLFWTNEAENGQQRSPSFLVFPSMTVAHALMDFWGFSIIIGRTSEQLYSFFIGGARSLFELRGDTTHRLRDLAAQSCCNKQVECALKILASADFCLRKNAGLAGKDHLFAFGIALCLSRMLQGPFARGMEKSLIEALSKFADEGIQFANCLIQQAKSRVSDSIVLSQGTDSLVEIQWGPGYQAQ